MAADSPYFDPAWAFPMSEGNRGMEGDLTNSESLRSAREAIVQHDGCGYRPFNRAQRKILKHSGAEPTNLGHCSKLFRPSLGHRAHQCDRTGGRRRFADREPLPRWLGDTEVLDPNSVP